MDNTATENGVWPSFRKRFGFAPLSASSVTNSTQSESAAIWNATAYAPEGLTDAGKDFARRYEERFHAAPGLHAALAYDSTRALLAALRKAPEANPARLRAEHGAMQRRVTGSVRDVHLRATIEKQPGKL